jgi:hypothetical protein
MLLPAVIPGILLIVRWRESENLYLRTAIRLPELLFHPEVIPGKNLNYPADLPIRKTDLDAMRVELGAGQNCLNRSPRSLASALVAFPDDVNKNACVYG